MKKGLNIMANFSKYDLCDTCRKIYVVPPRDNSEGMTVEQYANTMNPNYSHAFNGKES